MIAAELESAALAAGIGLLIGIERGWQEREREDGGRVAGIRTFTLIGGLGGITGLIALHWGGVALGLCFVAFAFPFGFFEWWRASRIGSYSVTDMVAGLLTFLLGSYAIHDMTVAAAAGVVTAAVLAERQPLHNFLRNLKWIELRAALMLLVMTLVLLPVLPDRTLDPWGALNPHQIWLMTVLAGTVCYIGYVAVRLAGERNGLLYGGLMGGLVTSTTVTWTFARFARQDPSQRLNVLAAILAAWIVSLIRMTALAVAIAPSLLAPLAPPIAAATIPLLASAAWSYWASGHAPHHELVLRDPLELSLVMRFCGLLAVIMLLAKIFSHGTSGLFTIGGLSGLLDVDPVTLSMAQMTGNGVTAIIAAGTILIAAASNGLAKAVLGVVFGGWKLGASLCALALLAFVAGAITYLSVG
jgi:uncharacterized membrane protein (DUF4010 family)